MGDKSNPPLLTRRDVEQRLNVSTATVRRLVEAGMLDPIMVGGQLRFDALDIENYLSQRRLSNTRTAS